MKLEQLDIENYMGITQATMDLKMPVHLVVGQNAAGKSTVRDALLMAFTGRVPHRGYRNKNQASQMVNDAAHTGEYRIVCKTNTGMYEATQRGVGKTSFDAGFELMLNPQAVLAMEPAARQAVFGPCLRADDTGKHIAEYLRDNHPELTQDIVKLILKDLNTAQDWAVEQRRIAGRTLKQLQANCPAPAPVQVTIADVTYDLRVEKCRPENIIAKEREAVDACARLQALDKSGVDVESIHEMNASLRKQLKELPAQEALDGDAEKATSVADAASLKYSTAAANEVRLQHDLNDAKASLKSLDTLEAECPHCLQAIPQEHVAVCREKYKKDIALLSIDVRGAAEAANVAKSNHAAARKAANTASEASQAARRLRMDWKQQISQNDAYIAEVAKNQHAEAIGTLTERIANLGLLRAAVADYSEWVAGDRNRQYMIAEAEATIATMNTVDGLLKPDGAVRMLENADVAGAQFDADLAAAWGMETLNLEPDGTVLFKGRPVEAASESEKWRAGALLAELLARAAGYGLLVLDGVDILDQPHRAALFGRMPSWMQQFSTIMLLMTGNPRTLKWPRESWVQGWVVENGVVAQVADIK